MFVPCCSEQDDAIFMYGGEHLHDGCKVTSGEASHFKDCVAPPGAEDAETE